MNQEEEEDLAGRDIKVGGSTRIVNGTERTARQRAGSAGKAALTVQTELDRPTTPAELVSLLHQLRSRRTHIHVMAKFHSHPSLISLVSAESYALLLRLAYVRSDLKLARFLLLQQTQRNIARSKPTLEAILYGHKKRGDVPGVERVMESMREQGWISYDFSHDRRDFGEIGKGKGDQWKAWGRRGWGSAKLIEDELSRKEKEKRKLEESNVARAFIAGEGDRPKAVIPLYPATLSGSTVIQLVDALVHERRAPEAFDAAEIWLDGNIPKRIIVKKIAPSTTIPSDAETDHTGPSNGSSTRSLLTSPTLTSLIGLSLSPTSAIEYAPAPIYVHARRHRSSAQINADRIFERARREYGARAIVLMNVLLKSLLINYAPPFGCTGFITDFMDKYSAPLVSSSSGPVSALTSTPRSLPNTTRSPLQRLYPDAITLRQLIMNLRSRPNSWRRAMTMINWFSKEFGGLPSENKSAFRRRFDLISPAPPPVSPLLPLSITPATPLSTSSLALSILPPTSRLPLPLARLLLNHAIASHKRLTINSPSRKQHAEEVRKWWSSCVDRLRRTDPEGWAERGNQETLRKARRCGLLPEGDASNGALISRGRRLSLVREARRKLISMNAGHQRETVMVNVDQILDVIDERKLAVQKVEEKKAEDE